MNEMKQHLDEGTIHAWLDGALSPDESARVQAHANVCADCAALVAEARGLMAASSRILSSLDAVPSGVIPGSTGTDQLAALRARRAALKRVWWRDRRFVAAASLVLVAGVSSVVWRTTQNETGSARANATVDSLHALPPAAAQAVSATVPDEPATRENASANAKAETNAPARDAGPGRALARQRAENADVKMAASTVSSAKEAAAVGAAQQAIDSTKALSRADQSAFERKVQQTVQSVPTPPRIIPEPTQQQAGAAPPATPPPSPTALAARNRTTADAASFSPGLRLNDLKSVAVGCYSLTLITPGEMHRTLTLADTLELLDEPIPERSDPTWFRARYLGASPDSATVALSWRMVDSATVELRTVPTSQGIRIAAYLLRFRVLPPGGGPPPDVTGLTNVRAALAVRVNCRLSG